MSDTYRYSKEHEWAKSEGASVRVGISAYAQEELGDVVFVDLPEVGNEVKQGETLTTVESVKAVSDVYAPIDGKVIEVNEALNDAPELVNQSPMEDGWIVIMEAKDSSQLDALMSADDYKSFVAELVK